MSQTQINDEILQTIETFYRDHCRDTLSKAVQTDTKTVEIPFPKLRRARPDVADDYLEHPETIRDHLEEALQTHDFPVPEDWSSYHVRVTNISDSATEVVEDVGMYLPTDVADQFVSMRGQISRISPKTVRFKEIQFECNRCGSINRVPQPDNGDLTEPHECQACERQGPFSPDLHASKEHGVNHQEVRLQVLPEKTENFRDDTIDIELEDDLVNSVAPGDRVAVNTQTELRLTDDDKANGELVGTAESIDRLDSTYEDVDIEGHIDRIEEIAAGEPLEDIRESIAPTHYGDEEIKTALALQLFSGPDLDVPGGGDVRGNIHIFMVGDPGVNKSGLLRRMKEISPRAVFTTGSGSTEAGLTASAVQDDFGDSAWTIKGGALVEAHEGLCAIDELDDMDEEDRAGLLEAMSDQEINVSKAGMNPTLPANTTVLAAANPKYGRFDQYESIGEQIDVDPALLSRFDLIFTLTDAVDEERDRELAEHLNDNIQDAQAHTRTGSAGSDDTGGPIDDDVLRAYIAKGHKIVPEITDEAKTQIEDYFVKLRTCNDEDGPIPVTPRIIEAMNRLSAAHARLRLSETVETQDVRIATTIIGSYMEDVGIDPETGEFDADVVETGNSKAQRDRIVTVRSIIQSVEEEYDRGAPIDVVTERAEENGISESKVQHAIENLKHDGEIYEPRTDMLMLT